MMECYKGSVSGSLEDSSRKKEDTQAAQMIWNDFNFYTYWFCRETVREKCLAQREMGPEA